MAAFLGAACAGTACASAQDLAALPDAPSAVTQPNTGSSSSVASSPAGPQTSSATAPQDAAASQAGQQTSRIFGIIPNFRSVNADQKLPPQTVRDKFVTASEDSFDYSSLVLPATVAAVAYERNSTPEFGRGGVGYGRYLWHSVVDQTVENYMVEFVVPAITHEDTRYYTLGHGGFTKRAGYALSRAFITRTDNDRETFNAGEIFGAGAAAGISNLYYPSRERSFSNTASQWALDVGIDAGTFVFKEFWPDINHALFHAAK